MNVPVGLLRLRIAFAAPLSTAPLAKQRRRIVPARLIEMRNAPFARAAGFCPDIIRAGDLAWSPSDERSAHRAGWEALIPDYE
ncbi:hypothetical protein [Bradyrhizobium ottawaense]|uniref:hypothetical protein n=1 Tax=Bradyrhizobium ottawaense TaxID=931866 RepID=UPI00103FBDAD|nr:hypothetical protein [Bradyrhizobium ottawaense]